MGLDFLTQDEMRQELESLRSEVLDLKAERDALKHDMEAQEKRRIFCFYILSRGYRAFFPEQTMGACTIPDIADELQVGVDIHSAKMEVNRAFPRKVAWGIECFLTGEPWKESLDVLIGKMPDVEAG